MPQMNKGGKFVFGKSNIQESGKVQFPIQAMAEYHAALDCRSISLPEAR